MVTANTGFIASSQGEGIILGLLLRGTETKDEIANFDGFFFFFHEPMILGRTEISGCYRARAIISFVVVEGRPGGRSKYYHNNVP